MSNPKSRTWPTPPINFDNTYAKLPGNFHTHLAPVPVANPRLIKINFDLAAELGIDGDFLGSSEGLEILSGNIVTEGSTPLAMAYGGHQFGNWAGQLGDGRAILLGEVLNIDGVRYDIQLKGSGQTPYSRGGDGRAWIGPVLREYVISEAMAALGIPTTRALAAVSTGQDVMREDIFPGAILTRVSRGHIRVGTFEYFASKNDVPSLKILADYVIDRHYPNARIAANPYLSLLESVITAQARLIAMWMGVGFIHGVMNTDNMSVFGETIDYGPCAFMDNYHPKTVYSYIDHGGRYAYANQPSIASWNLTSFASSILPLIDEDQEAATHLAQEAISKFSTLFNDAWESVLCKKIGIENPVKGDIEIARELLDIMAKNKLDFTNTFRRLSREQQDPCPDLEQWLKKWKTRLNLGKNEMAEVHGKMDLQNPAYIARNHRMEQMIAAALEGDYGPFEKMLKILGMPYDEQAENPENIAFQMPPRPHEVVKHTFCGT